MSRTRFRRALPLLGLLAVLALASPGGAGAAKPEPFTEPIDESFVVDDVCPFPYTQTLVGTVSGRTFLDAAGNPVREVARIRIDGTFAANGAVVPFVVRQIDHVTVNPDGSVTVASTGIIGRAKAAGVGVVGATIGRYVFTFPAGGGEPTVEFEAGRNNEEAFFGPILCGLLAP